MRTIGVHLARAQLSLLVDEAAAGEEIVITRAGQPMARLTALTAASTVRRRVLGRMAGRFTVPDDFDAPLRDDVLDAFEGR